MSKSRNDPRAAAVVYYDGACPLCRREIDIYQGMDGAACIKWSDANRDAFGADLSRESALRRFHVRRVDGSLASGAEAWAALWRAIPALACAGRILDRQPFLAIGQLGYRAFLLLRPSLQWAYARISRSERR
jgi:predicted DCC family thiol-disulfide oxidoreductase YuxK